MRLLIVEDEVRLASALQRGLAGEGFTVDLAHTGPDGLHAAQETTYDAVILDIMLPGLSGYRIIEALRAAENWVPILMLTAKDGEYDEADALDLGADDYLTKPFSFVVLLARIRALLRRGVTPRPASLTVGDLVLDPAAHTVTRGETTIDLTPREFALLEYLMRRAGDAVSARPRSCTTSGTRTTKVTPTWSRSTSATCAARSMRRSAGRACRRYVGPATG